MENLFVDGGKTIYSNSIGLEVDIRKDGYSLIPALTYTEYGTGDILFLQKGKDQTDAGNWSYVNSGLKAIYASVDLLWSVPINKNVEFEYGFGAGIGVVFGNLIDNWVQFTPAGRNARLHREQRPRASRSAWSLRRTWAAAILTTTRTRRRTSRRLHRKSWAGGGSVPNIFRRSPSPSSVSASSRSGRWESARRPRLLADRPSGSASRATTESRSAKIPLRRRPASNGEIRWGQR